MKHDADFSIGILQTGKLDLIGYEAEFVHLFCAARIKITYKRLDAN